jgi:hypothetical protein
MGASLGTLGKSRRRSGLDTGFVIDYREQIKGFLDVLEGVSGCLEAVRGELFGAEGGALIIPVQACRL